MKARHITLWIALAGVGAIAGGVSVRPTGNYLSPQEERAAFAPLIDAPVMPNGDTRPATLSFTIPDSRDWKRIRSLWGDPAYLVGVVSSSRPQFIYCRNQLDLDVRLFVDSRVVRPETAHIAPYGYTSLCEPVGLTFAARPGANVNLIATARAKTYGEPLRLIVQAYWMAEVKDRLVGSAIDDQLHLGIIWKAFVILGAALIAFASWRVVHRHL
jgi:hypothetical protein